MSSSTSHIATVAMAAAAGAAALDSGNMDAFKAVFATLTFINIAKMIANVGHGGIGLDKILMELLDNSLKAKATAVDVHLIADTRDGKLNSLVFGDDGTGMTLEEFINALFLGSDREYTKDDLGSFGMGLKNATWALGSTIVILTKTVSGTMFGAVMDLEKMKKANSLRPTVITPDIETLAYYFPDDVMERFHTLPSGTLILVKDIRNTYVTEVNALLHEARRSLNLTYRDLSGATVSLHCDGSSPESVTLNPLDTFYVKSPEKLRYASETTLRIYRHATGRGVDVFEVLTGSRIGGRVNGKCKSQIYTGAADAPICFKLTMSNTTIKKTGAVRSVHNQELVDFAALPSGPYEEIRVRFIEIDDEVYKSEGFADDFAHEDQRRRGIMCIRVNRRVSGFLTFGEKLDDYSNRFRMEVTFPPALDSEMGVRTQKQIDSKLNNMEIQNALRVLWHKQLTERIRIVKKKNGEKSDEESVVSEASARPAPSKKASKKASPPAAAPLPVVAEVVPDAVESRAASPVADAPVIDEPEAVAGAGIEHVTTDGPPVIDISLPVSPLLRPSPLHSPVSFAAPSPPHFNIEAHYALTVEQLLGCAEVKGKGATLLSLLKEILEE